MNFVEIDSKYATAAQPSTLQIQEKAKQGYTALVNLSPTTTPNYLSSEAAVAEEAGLSYIHYPVDCSNLRLDHYRIFSSIMKGMDDKKVLIHCGGNIKSSCLMHIYRVKEIGTDEKESWEDLLKIHQPEEKWINYFKSWGLQGIPA